MDVVLAMFRVSKAVFYECGNSMSVFATDLMILAQLALYGRDGALILQTTFLCHKMIGALTEKISF